MTKNEKCAQSTVKSDFWPFGPNWSIESNWLNESIKWIKWIQQRVSQSGHGSLSIELSVPSASEASPQLSEGRLITLIPRSVFDQSNDQLFKYFKQFPRWLESDQFGRPTRPSERMWGRIIDELAHVSADEWHFLEITAWGAQIGRIRVSPAVVAAFQTPRRGREGLTLDLYG